MSSAMFSGRTYLDEYLDFGFSFRYQVKNGKNLQAPFCLICEKELSNSSMKEFQLRYHYEAHLEKGHFVPSSEEMQVFLMFCSSCCFSYKK